MPRQESENSVAGILLTCLHPVSCATETPSFYSMLVTLSSWKLTSALLEDTVLWPLLALASAKGYSV